MTQFRRKKLISFQIFPNNVLLIVSKRQGPVLKKKNQPVQESNSEGKNQASLKDMYNMWFGF